MFSILIGGPITALLQKMPSDWSPALVLHCFFITLTLGGGSPPPLAAARQFAMPFRQFFPLSGARTGM